MTWHSPALETRVGKEAGRVSVFPQAYVIEGKVPAAWRPKEHVLPCELKDALLRAGCPRSKGTALTTSNMGKATAVHSLCSLSCPA